MTRSQRPLQLRDNNGQILQHKLTFDSMRVSRGGTPNIVYIGYANPNTTADEAAHIISKLTRDSSAVIVRTRQAVDGLERYADRDQVWDDSVAVTISTITKANPAQVTTATVHGLTTGDRIEITGSDATEANGDGYGSVMYKTIVLDTTNFTLVDVNTDLDVDSTGWVAAGTTGSMYRRTYANLQYV